MVPESRYGCSVFFISRLTDLNPTTGRCFITVDAYLSAVGFYQKCDFKFLVQPEPEDETALMFFDLKSILR